VNVENRKQLPDGWMWTTLGETTKTSQKRVVPKNFPNLPYIGMENIEPQTMRLLGTIPSAELKSSADSFYPGDVLYGRLRPYLNKVFCPDFAGLCSTEFIIFRKATHLNSKYLQYFLNQSNFVTYANSLNAGDRPRVKIEQLSSYPFPLPPLPEQERIVARIESLFTQLDAGVAALKRARAALKRYKASVLKAACEGRLGNKDINIVNEEIPKGWSRVTIGDVVESMKNGIYKPANYYSDEGIACLRMYNIDDGAIVWKNIKRMNLSEEEIETYRLLPGDILINRVNSRELVGKAAVVPNNIETCVYESKNIRLKIKSEIANEYYINYWFSSFGPHYFNFNAQQVVGMASINQTQITQMPILLPPLSEQQLIVEEVERRLTLAREVELSLKTNLKRAARLGQTILKAAFEGKLI
jgi:type I restriction enzyme S subunit